MLGAYVIIFVRAAAAALFVASACSKLLDRPAFVETIRGLRLFPDSLADAIAASIITLELGLAGIIGSGLFLSFGLGVAIALLVVFSVALMRLRSLDFSADCNCFGPGKEPNTSFDLGRNSIMVGTLALGLAYAGDSADLPALVDTNLALMASAYVLVVVNLQQIARALGWPLGTAIPPGRSGESETPV